MHDEPRFAAETYAFWINYRLNEWRIGRDVSIELHTTIADFVEAYGNEAIVWVAKALVYFNYPINKLPQHPTFDKIKMLAKEMNNAI